MNDRLESLKPLLKAGDYEKAAEALKEYRVEFPDDWDGKLMEGIIAKLRGDEETFRRIHDEAQAIIEAHVKDAAQIKASSLWKKYHSAWEKIAKMTVTGLKISVIGGLVAAGTIGGAAMLNKTVNLRVKWMYDVIVYGLAEANRRLEGATRYLYSVPVYEEYNTRKDDDLE